MSDQDRDFGDDIFRFLPAAEIDDNPLGLQFGITQDDIDQEFQQFHLPELTEEVEEIEAPRFNLHEETVETSLPPQLAQELRTGGQTARQSGQGGQVGRQVQRRRREPSTDESDYSDSSESESEDFHAVRFAKQHRRQNQGPPRKKNPPRGGGAGGSCPGSMPPRPRADVLQGQAAAARMPQPRARSDSYTRPKPPRLDAPMSDAGPGPSTSSGRAAAMPERRHPNVGTTRQPSEHKPQTAAEAWDQAHARALYSYQPSGLSAASTQMIGDTLRSEESSLTELSSLSSLSMPPNISGASATSTSTSRRKTDPTRKFVYNPAAVAPVVTPQHPVIPQTGQIVVLPRKTPTGFNCGSTAEFIPQSRVNYNKLGVSQARYVIAGKSHAFKFTKNSSPCIVCNKTGRQLCTVCENVFCSDCFRKAHEDMQLHHRSAYTLYYKQRDFRFDREICPVNKRLFNEWWHDCRCLKDPKKCTMFKSLPHKDRNLPSGVEIQQFMRKTGKVIPKSPSLDSTEVLRFLEYMLQRFSEATNIDTTQPHWYWRAIQSMLTKTSPVKQGILDNLMQCYSLRTVVSKYCREKTLHIFWHTIERMIEVIEDASNCSAHLIFDKITLMLCVYREVMEENETKLAALKKIF